MKWLTKSDYLKYLIHPAYLWLQKYDKAKLPPFDEPGRAVVKQGNAIERCARQRFEGGRIIESLFQDAVRDTEKAVTEGAKTIFQASVLTDRRLYSRADVLVKSGRNSWHIHEIKSTTKVKPEQLKDLAFQKIAMEESGYIVDKLFLIHINRQYVRRGSIDPKKLFIQVDVTAEVEPLLSRTYKGIERAFEIMAAPECPSDKPTASGNYYGWRNIYRQLHPKISETSLLNLCRLDIIQLRSLSKRGVTDMLDIPPEFALKPAQTMQLAALRAGQPIINPVKISNHLRKLRYPLYFFDYETVGGGLPLFDETRPYQQIPFQYSLHILHEPGGELEHREFLATGQDNPMPALLEQLTRDIGNSGSVIAWNKVFEMGVNSMMAAIYPDSRDHLRSINRRMYDLMESFSNGHYIDSRFMGSASIKKVLPVVVPELRYSDLEIQEGATASWLWQQTALEGIIGPEADQRYRNLRAYCGQDTLAMVRIYEFLMHTSVSAPGAQMNLLT